MARLVYGQNPVRELVAARPRDVSVVYVVMGDAGPASKELRQMCADRRIAVEERDRTELDALTGAGARHQGVVAIAGELAYAELDDLLERLPVERGLLVALDGVQDPHNLGAIVRSAHCLGADGVIIPKDRAAQVTPAVVKASAGATEHVPIARVTNLVRALEEMKERGLWIVGAVAEDAPAAPEVNLKRPLALVVGAEGKGLRPLVLRHVNLRVRIPMAGRVASLNVSVATGILLYEIARQRLGAKLA